MAANQGIAHSAYFQLFMKLELIAKSEGLKFSTCQFILPWCFF